MKTAAILKTMTLFICISLTSFTAFCQESPRETVNGTISGANLSISYGSPSVRGRKIWGDLVPYGKLWRTGANPVTTFETNKDVSIEGKVLPAGKYSIFTIPGENEWKIVFNSETGQWGIKDDGSANDDPAKDVLTVTVKPEKSKEFHEKLTFVIDQQGFALLWDNLAVPVAVK